MTQSPEVAVPAEEVTARNDNSNQRAEKRKNQDFLFGCRDLLHGKLGLLQMEGTKNMKLKCSVILNVIFAICLIVYIPISLTHKKSQYFCPNDWIGFRDKCYYFSKEERDWDSSKYNCSTQQADLTVIDNIEEMHFLKHYKCTSDHWIGLEMRENQRKWVNGTTFNNWFHVRGNETCAYLNDDGVATARCYAERKWICRK
ncbi:C-type lectin domain family 2 member B [Diceros bicornis minor]|uniref:C-type lectin domain family 2 member B n=1 Tax=Diceros bicornis minor TaxID=77932 RepID=UPI0026EF4637|nr:C-type lectin domain family 2 member B [Diceros bicornis minor]